MPPSLYTGLRRKKNHAHTTTAAASIKKLIILLLLNYSVPSSSTSEPSASSFVQLLYSTVTHAQIQTTTLQLNLLPSIIIFIVVDNF